MKGILNLLDDSMCELLQNFEANKDVLKKNCDIDVNEQHSYYMILSPENTEDIWG